MEKLPSLLKSKRFWVYVIGLVGLFLGTFNTEVGTQFEAMKEPILQLTSILIGGYAIEDVAEAWKTEVK